jgi:hypothetical protein
MFEMRYYDEHPNSPSNLLIKELVDYFNRVKAMGSKN